MKDKDGTDARRNSVNKQTSAPSPQTDPQALEANIVSKKKFFNKHLNKKKVNLILLFLSLLVTIWFFWPLWKNFLPKAMKSSISRILDVGRVDPHQLNIETLRKKMKVLELNYITDNEELRKYLNNLSIQSIKLTAIERRLDELAVGNNYEKLIRQITEEQKRLKFAQEKLTALFSNASASYNITEIKTRLQKLEEILKKDLAGKSFTSDGLYLAQKIDTRLKILEAENEQLSKTVAALQSRIQEVRLSQTPDQLNTAGILMLAFAHLKAVASTERGFQEEWAAVLALAANDTDLTLALNTMRPFMKNGAPTLNQLKHEFSSVADKISRSLNKSDSDGWIPRAIEKISSLITIRRTGTNLATNTDLLSPIDQAEIFLSRGNLNSAITAVGGLTGETANMAASWLSRARARAKINKALEKAQIILLSTSGMRPGG